MLTKKRTQDATEAQARVAQLQDRLAGIRSELAVLAGLIESHEQTGMADAVEAVLNGEPVEADKVEAWRREIEIYQRAESKLQTDLSRAMAGVAEERYAALRGEHNGFIKQLCVGLEMAKTALLAEEALRKSMMPFQPDFSAWGNHLGMYRALVTFNADKFARDQKARGFDV